MVEQTQSDFLSVRLLATAADAVEAATLATMALLLPLSPLAATLLSSDARYLRSYWPTIRICTRMVRALRQMRVISRNLIRALDRGKSGAQRIEGSCTHCGKCCVDRSCVFLRWNETGASRCSIYNNWFWKLTSCGSYPVDALSIDVYACPSFKAVPIRVIKNASRP